MINAIFLQDKHIHYSVLKYEAYVYSVQKLGKDLLNLAEHKNDSFINIISILLLLVQSYGLYNNLNTLQ
jgi:hypothetical protein